MTETTRLTRRTALAIGGAGLTAAALAACSPNDQSSPDSAPGSSTSGAGGSSGGGTEVAKLSEIPVGGSVDATLNGAPIVVAQPEAGKVVAYSAICTHQGCVVVAKGDEFDCPCHQSRFAAKTGEPFPGSKALKPLPRVAVTVSGDSVTAG